MQKAQSPDIFDVLEKELERGRAEVAGWRRDLGFLEAWKRVADQNRGCKCGFQARRA